MWINGSTNSMFEFRAKSLKPNDMYQSTTVSNSKPVPSILIPNNSIKDEYIPSVTSLEGETISTQHGFYGDGIVVIETSASTITNLEKILVDFLNKNSSLSYNFMDLNIDGNGKFVASDSTRFVIHHSNEESEKLKQKYVDELNSINVGRKSLGEAFLQAYARDFGVNLDDARAEGQEVGGLHFGFMDGLVREDSRSRSCCRIMTIGDTCYWINDNEAANANDKKLSTSISQNPNEVKNILNLLQTDIQNSNTNKTESQSSELELIKLPFFMTAQSVFSSMSDMMKDLNSMLLEGIMTQVLEPHNVELKDGDTISISLNGKGEFSINTDSSSIEGASDEEIERLGYNLENALNKVQTDNGKSLGKTLLEQFSADIGFDLAEAKKNENFSISFSFRYNSKIGKNEIFGAKLVQMNSLLSAQLEDEESSDQLSMPFQFITNNPEKEIDRNTAHE
jgi:hypothetical protein